MMRLSYGVIVAIAGTALGSGEVSAQAWPAKPVRVIVPFGAGSASDIVPRLVLDHMSRRLGQSFVVENRAGAGGTTGAAVVARADPDGYTILANSSAHTIAPALYPGLGYDPAKDFAAVVPLGASPFILVSPPAKGFKTPRDLVAAARSEPGKFNYASVGAGSASHLSAERFMFSAGIKAAHVPFKGGGEAMTEVMTGRIDFFFVAASAAVPNVRDGKLAALAVNGSTRSAVLPGVPTIAEAGISDAEYPLWYGLFAPSRTPKEIVDRLYRQARSALQDPALREKLAALAVDPLDLSPARFDALVKEEIARDAMLATSLGLKPN